MRECAVKTAVAAWRGCQAVGWQIKMFAMHPLLAGLIGAAIALSVVAFVVAVRRGRAAWHEVERMQRPPEASEDLTRIINSLPSGAVIVGPHDEILAVNEPGAALGLVRGSRLGRAELLDRVRAVRATREPFGGHLGKLLVRAIVLHDDSVLVLGEDESERTRAEAVRRDFVANVSHELKTPIGAISILAEAIESANDDREAVARFVTRLRMETARLAELVHQIIGLSRLQSSDPLLHQEEVSVSELVDEAVSRCRERAGQRGVSLIIARMAAAHVTGDRWQLVDAITNLVQNAINYSDKNARVAVSVKTTDGGQFVEVLVSDNGIGIKPEDQERIFERFYRVDYGRSREMGGTGLGLSVVRHIATAHGGNVRVWSSPGQGSTFTLRLPTRQSEEQG